MTISLLNSVKLAAARLEQFVAFHESEPGERFDVVTKLISEFGDDQEILSLGVSEKHILVFNKDGSAKMEVENDDVDAKKPNKKQLARHRGWNPALLATLAAGCVPCVADIDGARYGAGLTILAGRGDVGKTPFIHAFGAMLAGNDDYACVRFGEPLSGYTSDIETFVADIAISMLTHRVIVVDSFKDLVSAAGGNATTGGVTRGVFQIMSDLGAMAADRGCVIIAAINPTSTEQKVIDMINEAGRSNATTIVTSDNGTDWQVVTRVGEGLQRVQHKLTSEYRKDRLMHFVIGSKGLRNSKETKVQTTISNEELESVLRRNLS